MLLQFFLINSDFTTILPLAYFQHLSDGLSDGIYLEGREKLAALCLYCMYIPRPWATTTTTTIHSFVSSRWDWNSDWDWDWDLASIGACLLACLVWKGKWQSGETYREGGRARRSPQSLELRGRGSCMMGIEELIPTIYVKSLRVRNPFMYIFRLYIKTVWDGRKVKRYVSLASLGLGSCCTVVEMLRQSTLSTYGAAAILIFAAR